MVSNEEKGPEDGVVESGHDVMTSNGATDGPVTASQEEDEGPETTMEQLSAEIVQAVVNQVFSTRRPQHICAGVSSALKSVGKGLVLGVTTLIAAPAIAGMSPPSSSSEDGERESAATGTHKRTTCDSNMLTRCKGVAMGVGAGLLGALALPLTGAIVGLVQICRGAWNTPQALYEMTRGEKTWDQTERTWREVRRYSLVEEEQEVATAKQKRQAADRKKKTKKRLDGGGAAAAPSSSSHEDSEKDDYYEMLGVALDADEATIKRAYYKQARSCHPDKCGGDPRAAARFQKLSHAYQVLSDPKLRSAYDAGGAEAVGPDSLPDYDPAVFFAALFGTHPRLEAFVGELALSQLVGAVATRGGPAETAARALAARQASPTTDEVSKAMAEVALESRRAYAATQREREVSLARSLADLLDAAEDPKSLKDEAANLTQLDFDPTSLTKGSLVACLSSSYRAAADGWLGRRSVLAAPAAVASKVARAASRAQAYASAASAATRGVVAVKRVAEAVDEKNHKPSGTTRRVGRDELNCMSVSELKRLARDNGVETSTCCEKADLVDALLEGKPDGLEVTKGDDTNTAEDDSKRNDTLAGVPENAMKRALPIFLEAMVRVSIVDIHRTLEVVTAKVLDDESVDLDARRQRALRLRHFAKALDAEAYAQRRIQTNRSPPSADVAPTLQSEDDVAARFERAVNVTVARAMGQDLSDFDTRQPDNDRQA